MAKKIQPRKENDSVDCRQYSRQVQQVNSHQILKRHEPFRNKIFKRIECEICDAHFYRLRSFKDHMKQHIQSHQRKTPAIECDICGKEPLSKQNLETHMKNFHNKGISWHPCPIGKCKSKFASLHDNIKHRTVHLNPELWKCFYCLKETKRHKTYKRHMKRHHEFFKVY